MPFGIPWPWEDAIPDDDPTKHSEQDILDRAMKETEQGLETAKQAQDIRDGKADADAAIDEDEDLFADSKSRTSTQELLDKELALFEVGEYMPGFDVLGAYVLNDNLKEYVKVNDIWILKKDVPATHKDTTEQPKHDDNDSLWHSLLVSDRPLPLYIILSNMDPTGRGKLLVDYRIVNQKEKWKSGCPALNKPMSSDGTAHINRRTGEMLLKDAANNTHIITPRALAQKPDPIETQNGDLTNMTRTLAAETEHLALAREMARKQHFDTPYFITNPLINMQKENKNLPTVTWVRAYTMDMEIRNYEQVKHHYVDRALNPPNPSTATCTAPPMPPDAKPTEKFMGIFDSSTDAALAMGILAIAILIILIYM